ncbi:MAG: acyl carrier protein [Clostridiales bacterium]|nr:acyl carrier protein [Clostridiales bacterium]
MVLDTLKSILSEQLDIEEEMITEESLLVDDLGADSLDAINIIMSVEDEFKVEVPDEIIKKIETVGDIVSFIESKS